MHLTVIHPFTLQETSGEGVAKSVVEREFLKGDQITDEEEIKEVLAFYESPTGKKYVAAEPAFINELQSSGTAWRQKLANDLLVRVREEMKKKGVDF